MTTPELSAIVLCYRAEEAVLRLLEPLVDVLESSGVSWELVLVANYRPGMDDRTPAVVEAFARERSAVRTVIREKEGAMGWDMRTGLDAAIGEVLVVIDGDLQNPPADVLRAYRLLKESGAALVKGRRTLRHDGPLRCAVSIGYNALFRVVFATRGLWDINGKPKALTREAHRRLGLRSDDWFIDAEMVLAARRASLEIRELPVTFDANEERRSFVRAHAVWEFLRNIARARLGRPR